MLETLVRDAILDHLYSKKLIRETQHGFTKGRSCLTNVLIFLEEVTKYVDEGNPHWSIIPTFLLGTFLWSTATLAILQSSRTIPVAMLHLKMWLRGIANSFARLFNMTE